MNTEQQLTKDQETILKINNQVNAILEKYGYMMDAEIVSYGKTAIAQIILKKLGER